MTKLRKAQFIIAAILWSAGCALWIAEGSWYGTFFVWLACLALMPKAEIKNSPRFPSPEAWRAIRLMLAIAVVLVLYRLFLSKAFGERIGVTFWFGGILGFRWGWRKERRLAVTKVEREPSIF